MLRHGITEGNERRLYYGLTDLPLSPAGRRQAEASRRARPLPDCQLCLTSGLRRTDETLLLLTGRVPDITLGELREMDFGAFEMHSYEELKDDPDYRRWADDSTGQEVCPGGESFGQVYARAIADLTPVLERGEDAVCVMHGGAIATLMGIWFPGQGGFFDFMPQPGFGWQITFEDGKPVEKIRMPLAKEDI